jgi:hypothetical protein
MDFTKCYNFDKIYSHKEKIFCHLSVIDLKNCIIFQKFKIHPLIPLEKTSSYNQLCSYYEIIIWILSKL